MRPALLVIGLILEGVAIWLFVKFTSFANPATEGSNWAIGAIVAMVIGVVCITGYFVTKPKDNMEDISITKF